MRGIHTTSSQSQSVLSLLLDPSASQKEPLVMAVAILGIGMHIFLALGRISGAFQATVSATRES